MWYQVWIYVGSHRVYRNAICCWGYARKKIPLALQCRSLFRSNSPSNATCLCQLFCSLIIISMAPQGPAPATLAVIASLMLGMQPAESDSANSGVQRTTKLGDISAILSPSMLKNTLSQSSERVHFGPIRKGACFSPVHTLDAKRGPSAPGIHRIHQIWLGKREPPWLWIDTWRCDYTANSRNSQVEYYLWTETEIEQLEPPLENLRQCDCPRSSFSVHTAANWQSLVTDAWQIPQSTASFRCI
eukprot:SAG31_NODE_1724_length_7442_cov_3.433533_3_plen_244_part_00